MNLIETKSGEKTVKIDGKFIHSKYSPIKEADKFLNNIKDIESTVIVLGAGLGYIYRSIKIKNPQINIISIPYNRELGEMSKQLNPEQRIQFNEDTSIEDFIKVNISESNIRGLQILEWSPVATIYPEKSRTINKLLIDRVRRINGNILTTARFGKRWIQNTLKNYLNIENYIDKISINKPVVIVASGKSLQNSIKDIKKIRDNITLISLTSANRALKYYGITPDISFSTDPGYYSKLHVYGLESPLAMPLTNSMTVNSPILIINQDNSFEKEILMAGNIPHINIPENGTVAGTALDFAIKNSSGPIFLLGQDLAPSDVNSHINPYSFDNLLKMSEFKTSPHYSIMYKRMVSSAISYKTYRAWFSYYASKHSGRIFRVEPNSKQITNIQDITLFDFMQRVGKSVYKPGITFSLVKALDKNERTKTVLKVLERWHKEAKEKKIEENPLFYLISTSKYTDVKSKTLSNDKIIALKKEAKEELILFIKRLIKLYGRKLLQ